MFRCRICKQSNGISIIQLGEQALGSRFPKLGDMSTPRANLELLQCTDCGLVQLKDTIAASELYEHQYGYRSGLTHTMRTHLSQYSDMLQKMIVLQPGDCVLDIGSNDATFLGFYPHWVRKVGVDPTGKQFQAFYETGKIELVPSYFTRAAIEPLGISSFKVISSIACFYDLPDPVQFAQDVADLLSPDGLWTFEQSYILSMLHQNSFDTICHEHLEYYTVKQIQDILNRVGLKVVHISLNESNGGSFRVFAAKRNSLKFTEAVKDIQALLQDEVEAKLDEPQTYRDFMSRCTEQLRKLKYLQDIATNNNQEIWVYGASTKGNTLLQYASCVTVHPLSRGLQPFRYAVERNLEKVGCMTPGTHIEIISEATMRSKPPKYLLVMPWHFQKEIIQREQEFMNDGGFLVFPLPQFRIVSAKPKLLLTGAGGQIGRHLPPYFKDHHIFGTTRLADSEGKLQYPRGSEITHINIDLRNVDELTRLITTLEPDKIIHLAGVGTMEASLADPVNAIETNGMIAVHLCDVLCRYKLTTTKLFNASSAELFKGHQTYVVRDGDTNFKSITPYAIGKQVSHQTLMYYRRTHNMLFSNGIIFTTESKLREPTFLMKKIVDHIQNWLLAGTKTEPLRVGSLSSYRNIQHADDVCAAIRLIVDAPNAGDYVISGPQSRTMMDWVKMCCTEAGIELEERENQPTIYWDKKRNCIFLIVDADNYRNQMCSRIEGDSRWLLDHGWVPHSPESLVQKLLN